MEISITCNSKEERAKETWKLFAEEFPDLFNTVPSNWAENNYLSEQGMRAINDYYQKRKEYYHANTPLMLYNLYSHEDETFRKSAHHLFEKVDSFCKKFIAATYNGAQKVIEPFWTDLDSGFWSVVSEVFLIDFLESKQNLKIIRFGEKIPNSNTDADILAEFYSSGKAIKTYIEVRNQEIPHKILTDVNRLRKAINLRSDQFFNQKHFCNIPNDCMGVIAMLFKIWDNDIMFDYFSNAGKIKYKNSNNVENIYSTSYVFRINPTTHEFFIIGGK